MTFAEGLYALGVYFLVASLVGFMAILWDREARRKRTWRIPIRLMLGLALVGGSAGIITGRNLLAHKDQAEPFTAYLRMIVFVQFTVLMLLAIPQVRDWVHDFFYPTWYDPEPS